MIRIILFLLFFLSGLHLSTQVVGHWESRTPMPVARTNMATASLTLGDTTWLFTFMGLDSSKACGNGVRLEAFKYNTISQKWYPIASVPDTEGRIAASATGWGGKVFLIGGYKVFQNCNEFSSPRVDIYDPISDTWSLGDSTPVPIDDHVQALWRDSLIYCVSGWSQSTNVRNVQLYNPALDTWTQASQIQGPGLFGHCGGIVGDTLIYVDGVRIAGFNFVLNNEIYRGVIDTMNPASISWTRIGAHPGPRVYRGGGFQVGTRIVITGGTDNAYNINGIGYNGQPSVETGRTWGYDLSSGSFERYVPNPDSVMDVRQIVEGEPGHFYVVGGMRANQTVSNQVSVFIVDSVLTSRDHAEEQHQHLSHLLWVDYGAAEAHVRIPKTGQARLALLDMKGSENLIFQGILQQGQTYRFPLPNPYQGIGLLYLQTENGITTTKVLLGKN